MNSIFQAAAAQLTAPDSLSARLLRRLPGWASILRIADSRLISTSSRIFLVVPLLARIAEAASTSHVVAVVVAALDFPVSAIPTNLLRMFWASCLSVGGGYMAKALAPSILTAFRDFDEWSSGDDGARRLRRELERDHGTTNQAFIATSMHQGYRDALETAARARPRTRAILLAFYALAVYLVGRVALSQLWLVWRLTDPTALLW